MDLQKKYGITMNLKKIARIKKQYGLITKIRKKNPYNVSFKKGLEHRTAPNLLQRHFDVKVPDTVYSTDISYLIYNGGQRAYLSATKDLATKEIVAFNVSKELSMQTAYLGLEETLKHKDCSKLMIHSDQGTHYTHPLYVNKLKDIVESDVCHPLTYYTHGGKTLIPIDQNHNWRDDEQEVKFIEVGI